MSPAQTSLYFREWGKVRAHYIAQGIDPKQADNKRHELHRRALGFDKSSKAFTNADLDKVLSAFYAVTRPADLAAQLRQLDQPDQRRALALEKCNAAMMDLFLAGENGLQSEHARAAYMGAIARRVRRRETADCNAEDLAVVHGVIRLQITRAQDKRAGRHKQSPGALKSTAAEPGEVPF